MISKVLFPDLLINYDELEIHHGVKRNGRYKETIMARYRGCDLALKVGGRGGRERFLTEKDSYPA